MTSFNSMQALSSGVTPAIDALGLNGGGQSLGIDDFDQDLNFDESILDGVNGGALPPMPFTNSYEFDTYSTTFEDPFSYPGVRPYDGVTADVENLHGDEPSPHELDNKLLGFSAPIMKAALVGDGGSAGGAGQFAELGMSAELYGMFFVAEDVFGSDSNPARPLELTCYRRNLWQCSGQITLPRHLSAVVDEQGRRLPVFDLAASITAIESIEGKPTEIISIPWKSGGGAASSAGPGAGDEATKVASAPPTLALDLAGGQDVDGSSVSVPVSWKRLQFKHATANNGRRKGLQQHYVVQINLLARTKSGDQVKIAEIQSGPVIVRGRSPRNFDSRKDVPLTGGAGGGDKRLERRGTDPSTSSVASLGHGGGGGGGSIKGEKGDLAQNMQRYHSLGNIQPLPQSSDWPTPQIAFHHQSPHPSKKLALSPNPSRPPVPPWSPDTSLSSPSMQGPHHQYFHSQQQQQSQQQQHTTTQTLTKGSRSSATSTLLPINLSLSEDDRSSPNRSGSSVSDSIQSPHFSMLGAGAGAGTGAGVGAGAGAGAGAGTSSSAAAAAAQAQAAGQTGQGPGGCAAESEDLLYEYFPLSLDDWVLPVDAIYRPHVVHHTIIPPEVRAQQTRNRTKRYFAAE